MKTSTTPFLARLKEATRPYHEATEQSVNLGQRMKTIDGYRKLLAQFLGFYEPAEARLVPLLENHPGLSFPQRRKTHLLRNDLRSLGLDDAAISALPRYQGLPALDGVIPALGSMYVLEGATLGGQYITKHVQSQLQVEPGHGCDFFNSYGDNVGPMWKAFRDVLDRAATDEQDQDVIIHSAQDTFDHFHRWFLGNAS